ncbi:hypothetical protein SOPP22_07085 [Shewanella sp. OPT22]|nr:hypothetical protein SOPP22_07085 [Shewanella sp. OPT22]
MTGYSTISFCDVGSEAIMKKLLFGISLIIALVSLPSHAFETWRSYIDGRVDGLTYYLVKETYQKLKYKRPNVDKNATAYDLGCRSGNEDTFLLEKGWNVNCINPTTRPIHIMTQRAKGLPGHFTFQQGHLSKLTMKGKYDFVYAIRSLPFEKQSDMLGIFQTIHDHLKSNGVFAFTMNGPDASFNKDGSTFGLTPQELKNLISEADFKVETLLHRKYDQKDFEGDRQQWDVYDVVVRNN